MKTELLTPEFIARELAPGTYADSDGLVLSVASNGRKAWRYSYTVGMRSRSLQLGSYPRLSLADARLARDAARAERFAGEDPGARRRPLTDLELRGSMELGKHFDGQGLYLEVRVDRSKVWRFKYRHSGVERLTSFGKYPEVGLKEARERREHARRLLRDGHDPIEYRRAKQRQALLLAANSFEKVATEWVTLMRCKWTQSHADRVLKSLTSHDLAPIGTRPLQLIEPPELLAAVRNVEKRGKIETAHKVLQRCGAVFRYGIQTGRCKRNPASDLRGALRPIKVEHYPKLTEPELPPFLRALEAHAGHPQTVLFAKLLLLTMVRQGELRFARWDEFDLNAKLWRIPAERMKMRAAHIVPLSRQAIEALEGLRKLNGHREYLTYSIHDHAKPLSENAVNSVIRRIGFAGKIVGHGFRGTASTILNERGFTPDAIERQLAHAEQNAVRAAYNAAQYLPERTRMMQAWADLLDELREHGRVASLDEKRNVA